MDQLSYLKTRDLAVRLRWQFPEPLALPDMGEMAWRGEASQGSHTEKSNKLASLKTISPASPILRASEAQLHMACYMSLITIICCLLLAFIWDPGGGNCELILMLVFIITFKTILWFQEVFHSANFLHNNTFLKRVIQSRSNLGLGFDAILPSSLPYFSLCFISQRWFFQCQQNEPKFLLFPGKKDNLSETHFVKLMFLAHRKLVFLTQLCKYQDLSCPVISLSLCSFGGQSYTCTEAYAECAFLCNMFIDMERTPGRL